MPKPITPDVAVAYTLCPRKAHLLLCTDEQGAPHDYPGILAADQRRNQASYFKTSTVSNKGMATIRGMVGPSLSTSGETLTIEESMTLRARTETAGHVGDEHEWSQGRG